MAETKFSTDGVNYISVLITGTLTSALVSNYGGTNLTNVIIGSAVTTIDSNAFSGCILLTSVLLGTNVTTINDNAFQNCNSLKTIRFNGLPLTVSNSIFNGIGAINNRVIMFNATTEGDINSNLVNASKAIVTSTSVNSVGPQLFIVLNQTKISKDGGAIYSSTLVNGTLLNTDLGGNGIQRSRITDVIVGTEVTAISDSAFANSGTINVFIPTSVTSFGNSAFQGCLRLTSITIPDSILTMGYDAFNGCTSLTSVSIGSNITNIQSTTFNGCTILAKIGIGLNVSTIGSTAFVNCTSLNEMTFNGFPSTLTSVNSNIFSGITANGTRKITFNNTINESQINSNLLTASKNIVTNKTVSSSGPQLFMATNTLFSTNGGTSYTSIYINGELTQSIVNENGGSELTNVIIGTNVTSIGSSAFNGCTKLTSITNMNVTSINTSAFNGCTNLTNITIENSVTSIGANAFSGCIRISTISIGTGITTINSNAFSNCSALTTVTFNGLPSTLTSVNSNIFSGITANGTRRIIFNNTENSSHINSNLLTASRTIVTNQTVSSSGPQLFIVTPTQFSTNGGTSYSSVIVIGELTRGIVDANGGRDNVTDVIIGIGVTSIGQQAFAPNGTSKLKSVVFPNTGLTSTGSLGFEYCRLLTNVTIPNSVTTMNASFKSCSGLTSIIIPSSVTTLGIAGFFGCTNLSSITLSQNLINIRQQTFENCTSLSSIVIPNNVTLIGYSAFWNCTSLANVSIGTSVTTIGSRAFRSCPLAYISFNGSASTLTSVQIDIFDSISRNDTRQIIFNASSESQINSNLLTASKGIVSLSNQTPTPSGPQLFLVSPTQFSTDGGITYNSVAIGGTLTQTIVNANGGSNITDVILGTVITIGNNAFSECTNLTNVTVSSTVTTINSNAFSTCTALSSMIFNGLPSTITSVNSNIFDNIRENGTRTFIFNNTENANEINSNLLTASQSIVTNKTASPAGPQLFIFTPTQFSINNGVSYTSVSIVGELTETIVNANGGKELTNVIIGGGVTSIGIGAFRFCVKLTSVSIPSGMLTIRTSAFQSCTLITNIDIPNTVTTIGEIAFLNCTSLSSVTIGTSVTTISNSAFETCTSLSNMTFNGVPSTISSVGGSIFAFINPNNTRTYTFNNTILESQINSNLLSQIRSTVQDSTVSITGPQIFNVPPINTLFSTNGVSYTSVSVVGELTQTIVNNNGGHFLTNVIIGTTVTSIGENAFLNCSNISNLLIGSNVTSIGNSAFQGCISLPNMIISNSITNIGSSAFQGCTSFTNISIPDSITNINSSVFQGCTALTIIDIPNNVTTIGVSAFQGCTALTIIDIPNNVTTIGVSAFQGCTTLANVNVGGNVSTIGSNAFQNCNALSNMEFNGIPYTITSVGETIFNNVSANNTRTITFNNTSNENQINTTLLTAVQSIVINQDVSKNGPQIFIVSPINTLFSINGGVSYTSVSVIGELTQTIVSNNGGTNITDVIIGTGVTIIGINAFQGCIHLISVLVETNVTTINSNAFQNCNALTNMDFYGLPSTITSVSNDIFSDITSNNTRTFTFYNIINEDQINANLLNACKSIVFVTTVSVIGPQIFIIPLMNTLFSIDGGITYTSVSVIGELTQTIVSNNGGRNITKAIIGNGVTSIGSSAFYDCRILTDVFIGDNVTTFYDRVFALCFSLSNVKFYGLPSTITTIYQPNTLFLFIASNNTRTFTFFNTYSESQINPYLLNEIKSIVNNTTVSVFGPQIFIEEPTSFSKDGGITYESVVINGALTQELVNYLDGSTFTNIIIGSGVTSIGSSAFENCTLLETVYMKTDISSLGDNAFSNCTTLKSFVIGNVSVIGNLVFQNCNALLNIQFAGLPSGLTNVSSNLFNGITEVNSRIVTFNYTSNDSQINSTLLSAVDAIVSNTNVSTTGPQIFISSLGPLYTQSPKIMGDAPYALTNPVSESPAQFVYSSSNTSVASLIGNVVTINGAGSCIITATQPPYESYLGATTSSALDVYKTITVLGSLNTQSPKTYGHAPYLLTDPSSNSDGPFTYTSSNTSVADICGNLVTITGAGECFITAYQAETPYYYSADTSANLIVNKATPTIGPLDTQSPQVYGVTYELMDPSSDSSGAFTYTSSNTSIATINGNMVTTVGIGSCIITAYQADTNNYLSGDVSANLIVNKASPTIGPLDTQSPQYWGVTYTLTNPSSNSLGAFTYTSSETSIAIINGNNVNTIIPGTTIITAYQAETAYYTSGDVSANLIVNKAIPTIGPLGTQSPKTYGNDPYTLTDPSSNSPGAFTYTSSNTSVADVCGNVVTIIGAGSCNIIAYQEETNLYTSGSTSSPLTVNKATAILTNFSIPPKTYGDEPFQITDPSSNSPGAFVFSVDGSIPQPVADICGNIITIIGAGIATINASQEATNNYTSATISNLFTVNKADPTIGTLDTQSPKTYGDAPYALTAPISNSPGAFTYESLDPSYAVVVGNIVTILKATEHCTIMAYQAETNNYYAGDTSSNLIILKASPHLRNFAIPVKLLGDEPFPIPPPTTNSPGAIIYESLNTDVAVISGYYYYYDNYITIVGAGTSVITAFQEETENYRSQTIGTEFNVAVPINTSEGLQNYLNSDVKVGVITTNELIVPDNISIASSKELCSDETITITKSPYYY
jgi:hypothetical protein